jgi:lipase chaperone LimK
MKNSKAASVVIFIILLLLFHQVFTKNNHSAEKNGIDNEKNITRTDNMLSIETIHHTIEFFAYLQDKFRGACFEDHLKKVETYFYSLMDPQRADEMFALYKKFTQCKKNQLNVLTNSFYPKSPHERIQYLNDLREYRRVCFGKELADALFGWQDKSLNYDIRKRAILEDKDLYGAQKEKRLNELRREIWGGEANNIDSGRNPYELYREKISMYDKDMGELSDEERNEKINSLRKEFFPLDAIALIKKVDEKLARKKRAEDQNHQNEQKLKSGPTSTTEEKEQRSNYSHN